MLQEVAWSDEICCKDNSVPIGIKFLLVLTLQREGLGKEYQERKCRKGARKGPGSQNEAQEDLHDILETS